MTVSRHLARPLLSSVFLVGGVDTLRNPTGKVAVAEDVAPAVAATIPGLEAMETEQLVRINAGVQVAAGALLAIGRIPRLSALALAATLVPATAAGHRFWEHDGPLRAQHQTHFFKNVSLFGGLLLAALDTEGRPGVLWRTRHASEHAGAAVRRTRREARLAARAARPRRAAAARARRRAAAA
jgi:uncharacterized membrane protein YphA (DoxX/SURF4 family)